MRTLLKVIKYLAIYFVSFVLLSFAVSKFLGAQFQVYNYAEYTPLKELPRFWHAWSFFGRSYAYNVFIGITELTAGILILFDRTRLAGLLLAVGIYVNIIFIDVEFEVNNAIVHSTVEFIIICFLLLPYLPDLKKYFWDMSGKYRNGSFSGGRILNGVLPFVFIILTVIAVTFLLKTSLSKEDKMIGAYRITGINLNGDTLSLGQGIYSKSPMLFFEFDHNTIFSLNDTVYTARYSSTNDSVFIHFYKPFDSINSIVASISKDGRLLKGVTDMAEPVEISIIKEENVK